MIKFAIPTLTAALALAACSETNNYDTADADGTAAEAPVVSETTVVTEPAETDGDRISIGEDGVSADITDGDTRIRADVDGDPSLTVETD